MMPPAKFPYWDTIDPLTRNEAIWLWCDLEPPGEEESRPLSTYLTPPAPRPILPAMGGRVSRNLPRKDTYPATYSREELRGLAINLGDYRPRFLFPEKYTIQTDLRLDKALEIIGALSKALDNRYNTGKKCCPQGLQAKVIHGGDLLGLTLDSGTVSKYLNAAVKKLKVM